MLEQSPPPLTRQLTDLAAGVRAEAALRAAEAGLVAALHALILGCLARLLARLDDLAALWVSGQLPHPNHTIAPPHPSRAARDGASPPAGPSSGTPSCGAPSRGANPGHAPPAPIMRAPRVAPERPPARTRAPLPLPAHPIAQRRALEAAVERCNFSNDAMPRRYSHGLNVA